MQFQANTFEEMAQLSRNHGMEMFKKGDVAHIEAMQKMQDVMRSPEAMSTWMEEKRKEFEGLPEM